MFKFIKAKGPHQSAERQKLQKELFSYRRVSQVRFLLHFNLFLRLLLIMGLIKFYLFVLSLYPLQDNRCFGIHTLQILFCVNIELVPFFRDKNITKCLLDLLVV